MHDLDFNDPDVFRERIRTGPYSEPVNPEDVQLAEAIRFGQTEEVRTALVSGADPNAYLDFTALKPLVIAARVGSLEKVVVLLEFGACRRTDQKKDALSIAASKGTLDILKVLIGSENEFKFDSPRGSSLLLSAAMGNQFETAQFLIDEGVDSDARTVDGFFPIDGAIGRLYRPMFDLIRSHMNDRNRKWSDREWEKELIRHRARDGGLS